MEYCYVKFDTTNFNARVKNSFALNSIVNGIHKVIASIFPYFNSDYDEVINNVNIWLIEFEKNTQHPNREIGIDQNNKVITKSPWRGRYAYWADINLKLSDFKRKFNAKEINEQEFEHLWNSFNLNQ